MNEELVPREALAKLEHYLELLRAGNGSQNLVSASTLAFAWDRHILDAAQLSPLVVGSTVDIGSGAGLPGIVLAILGHDLTLVEPRRKRCEFLRSAVLELRLPSVTVLKANAIEVEQLFSTITARAVAPLDRLLGLTLHLAMPETRWVLPKGKSVHAELEAARAMWHGRFELVPSVTDPAGMIVVAHDVKPRSRR